MMKSNFDTMYESYRRESERILDELFPKDYIPTGLPAILEESMRYSLFSGGKRLRPILVLAAYSSCGGKGKDAGYLACAVEMIHTYSLIHDDLPCMDDDELRRGKPTNHIVYGYPMAVLAGDGLLNLAFETMFRGSLESADKDKYLKAAYTLSEAAGMKGMVGGQAADISWEGSEPDKEKLSLIHRNKTGALIRASLLAGGMCATDDEKVLKALSEYGSLIGEMFQVVDDILDVVGNTEEIGKNVNKDAQMNKMTYPYVYGLENSKIRVEELAKAAENALLPMKNTEFFLSLIEYLKNRTK